MRRVNSRALRAASRAAAASTTLATTRRASFGCSSKYWPRRSLISASITGRASEDTSLSLVWLENLGSGSLIESTQVNPSRASSPPSDTFSRLAMPEEIA